MVVHTAGLHLVLSVKPTMNPVSSIDFSLALTRAQATPGGYPLQPSSPVHRCGNQRQLLCEFAQASTESMQAAPSSLRQALAPRSPGGAFEWGIAPGPRRFAGPSFVALRPARVGDRFGGEIPWLVSLGRGRPSLIDETATH